MNALQAFYAWRAHLWEVKYGLLGCTNTWCKFEYAFWLGIVLSIVFLVAAVCLLRHRPSLVDEVRTRHAARDAARRGCGR